MIKSMIRTITAKYHLNGITTGEFSKMKLGGMNYEVWAFHAEGLGHVSAMTAAGFLGLTKTDALIINPMEKDMPLYIYNRIHSKGSDTLSCELYDTILESCDLRRMNTVKEEFSSLPDYDPSSRWSEPIRLPESLTKKGKKAQTAAFDSCAMKWLDAFLEAAEDALWCDPAGKKEKSSVYVDGLLVNGGSFADTFLKGIGDENTAVLFRNILFGTAR